MAHWRGDLSLAKSALLNGLLVYLVLVSTLAVAGPFIQSQSFVFLGLLMFGIWGVWAVVGIARCAAGIIFSRRSKTIHRALGVFTLIGVIAFVVITANDLLVLFT